MLLRTAYAMVLLLFLFTSVVASSASSADLRLIQLVPPESKIIAGMVDHPSPEGEPRGFLLITVNNRVDFEDFLAVTGADTSRAIELVVFVAASGRESILSEHSLLVGGHFNREAIFRFANLETSSYRGVAVLVVPALARERGTFNEVRWLAIVGSEIAIFGTPASVQRELDREIANSRPDPFLMARLSRLGSHDDAWCLLPVHSVSGVVQSVLEKLDPKLGAVAREGGLMQYGIHFGRRVEITASSFVVQAGESSQNEESSSVPSSAAHSFLAALPGAGQGGGQTIVVKVAQRRYEEWLAGFSNHGLTIGGAVSH
jgi:hypothetical protein